MLLLNNLLVIAFHYPPDNSSTGVLRTAKFTEYLLRHDWRSHVVTAPSSLYVSHNPEGVDTIPAQVTVDRAWGCDVKKVFGFRGIYPAWLGIPDRFWPWYFAARGAGARAIRQRGIKAIYSTYPLPTAHLVGLALKKRFGLPWLADFRDPWATVGETGFAAKTEVYLERKVVLAADRVICNTPAMRRDFLARYPEVPAERFVTITNGYDERDFAAIVPVPAPRFQIFYPGSIDAENRNPRGLFAGIRYALDRGWLSEQDLGIVFLGAGVYAGSERFRRDLATFALAPHVEIVKERVPYREALARMAGSDVVVVLSEHLTDDGSASSINQWTAMQVPAKLYEYLRIGRPLLAIAGDGAVKELLEKTGAGTAFRSADTERIALTLKDYYERRKMAVPGQASTSVADTVTEFSRERLTALLARELDVLVAAPHAAAAPLAVNAKR